MEDHCTMYIVTKKGGGGGNKTGNHLAVFRMMTEIFIKGAALSLTSDRETNTYLR